MLTFSLIVKLEIYYQTPTIFIPLLLVLQINYLESKIQELKRGQLWRVGKATAVEPNSGSVLVWPVINEGQWALTQTVNHLLL